MASNMPELDDVRRSSGYELLSMLDGVGFGAIGAAWVLDEDSDRWRYLLISPMIDSKGPHWVYERLLQVFRKLKLPKGITPLDIVVASPREIDMQRLTHITHTNGALMIVSGMMVNDMHVHFMAIYRMLPFAPRDAGERVKAFDRKVAQLMAA